MNFKKITKNGAIKKRNRYNQKFNEFGKMKIEELKALLDKKMSYTDCQALRDVMEILIKQAVPKQANA